MESFSCVILLLIYLLYFILFLFHFLFHFFYFELARICVTDFCGPFGILFWFELIKDETNITKKFFSKDII